MRNLSLNDTQLDQYTLIKNYNQLVKALNRIGVKTNTVQENGLCDGLAKLFIFYAEQERKDEFFSYITFINSLNQEEIDDVMLFKNKLKEKEVKLDKLIHFMEAVNQTQINQYFFDYQFD